MCGIACILDIRSDPIALRERAVEMADCCDTEGPTGAACTQTKTQSSPRAAFHRRC